MSNDDETSWAGSLTEGTTDGPWMVDVEVDGVLAGRSTVVRSPSGQRVVTVDQTRAHDQEHAEANVAFIAAARTMFPALERKMLDLETENRRLREYAGPGPYVPSDADGAKAPTWQDLRQLADHNFRLYAEQADRLRQLASAIDAALALAAQMGPEDHVPWAATVARLRKAATTTTTSETGS